MKIIQAHAECGHDDHLYGMAALKVTLIPWDDTPERQAIQRCDECDSLGNMWTDAEALAAVESYTPGTWRHTDWCQTPTGHPGDCWAENNRALGIEPGPAITIVEV